MGKKRESNTGDRNMALSFGFLQQTDVRETPVSTATATSVGLTDGKYIVADYHADMSDERKITEGTGITLTDAGANSTFTIASNDSEIVHDNLSGYEANEHIVYTAGAGIDIAAGVVSGEDASTSNKGIAQFSSNDFTVSSGAVSLKSKTSYWSTPGSAFIPINPDINDVQINGSYGTLSITSGSSVSCSAPVNLPNGAIVTACIVYGTGTSEAWRLYRTNITNASTAGTEMATANLDSEDSSISSATIDNSTYKYWLNVTSIDTGESIHGARITYTTDYD